MTDFTEEETDAMRDAGLTLYADRVLYELQPPIDELTLARIALQCAGPLPDDLVQLWRIGFGGTVDYDLSVRFDEHVANFSFRELFYVGSSHYHDLLGWMEAQLEFEQEAAAAADKPHPGKLQFLPFGGFEYLDRLFVDVSGGPHHGSVCAWMRGLPPAWVLRLNEDSQARIAPDLPSLFRLLDLADDPFAPTTDYPSGAEMLEAIDALAEAGPAGASAAEKLRDRIRAAVLDWRAALDDGSISQNPRLRALAWSATCHTDDLSLFDRLRAAGCDPSEAFGGGGTALDHALQQGSFTLAERLIDVDAAASNPIRSGAPSMPLHLARRLVDRGEVVDAIAVLSSHRNDDEAVTELLASTLSDTAPADVPALIRNARASAEGQRSSANRVASGKMFSNWTPDQYEAAGDRLDRLANWLER